MSTNGRGMYLGVDDALDDDFWDADEREYCHWCRKELTYEPAYGIEGHEFCDADCADAWWWEWCRE